MSENLLRENTECDSKIRQLIQQQYHPNSKEISILQNKIQENTEKLIREDFPFAFERDIEQSFWRLIYKIIETYRGLLKKASSTRRTTGKEEYLKVIAPFRGFLIQTSGFYLGIIELLQKKYGLQFDSSEAYFLKNSHEQQLQLKYKAIQSCHRCLIFLGDLARYKELYSETSKKNYSAAHDYYCQALNILPFNGHPHNQLAVLTTYAENEFLSVYHYYLCLISEIPFATSKENLNLIFQKNKEKFLNYKDKEKDNNQKDRSKNDDDKTQTLMVLHSIRMFGILFTQTDLEEFEGVQRQAFKYLDNLMKRRNKPISSGTLIVFLIISMATVHYLRIYKPKNDIEVSENNAQDLALSMLFQLFSKILSFCKNLCTESSQKNTGNSFIKAISIVESILPSIKLITDWVYSNYDYWSQFSQKQIPAMTSFWNNLSECLNCLWIHSPVELAFLKQTFPLPEDLQHRSFLPLIKSLESVDWKKYKSIVNQESQKEVHDNRVKSIFSNACYFVEQKPRYLRLQTSHEKPPRNATFFPVSEDNPEPEFKFVPPQYFPNYLKNFGQSIPQNNTQIPSPTKNVPPIQNGQHQYQQQPMYYHIQGQNQSPPKTLHPFNRSQIQTPTITPAQHFQSPTLDFEKSVAQQNNNVVMDMDNDDQDDLDEDDNEVVYFHGRQSQSDPRNSPRSNLNVIGSERRSDSPLNFATLPPPKIEPIPSTQSMNPWSFGTSNPFIFSDFSKSTQSNESLPANLFDSFGMNGFGSHPTDTIGTNNPFIQPTKKTAPPPGF